MTAEASKSVLSREQIRQALAVLREEQQAHPISPAQRRVFRWYGISVWFFFISFLVLIFYLWIKPEGLRFLARVNGSFYAIVLLFFSNTKLILDTWREFRLALFLAGVNAVSFFAIVLLFFLNTKLILYTWREFRLALRTKLWQLVTQMRTGPRWPRRLIIGIGAAFFLVGVAFLAGTLGALTVAIFTLPLTVALLAFFFLGFARRRLDVLRNSDQLVAFLTKLDASEGPTGIGRVAIPTGVFEEIGAIEDIHIQRHRAKAIDEFRHSGLGYAVVRSRAVIADIAKLDEASQLRIEARIAELASESPPPEATLEPGGIWRVPVTETPYEIICRQDQAAHRIELLSLRQSDGTSSTLPIAEAPRG
jgi:hypothetical protein